MAAARDDKLARGTIALQAGGAGRVRFRNIKVRPAIRARLKKSQSEFAAMIGVSVSTLQNWEQERRVPEGPARALLKVAAEQLEAVEEALGGGSARAG